MGENEAKSLNYYDQVNTLKQQRKTDEYLAKVNFSATQDVLRRLEKAFEAFYRGLKAGEKPGYPRFKPKGRYDSVTFPAYVTVKCRAGLWYVCFTCEVEPVALPPSEEATGVDLGVENFAITSDGEVFENQKHLCKAERNLKRLQRQVCRRKKGSNSRQKAVRQLARGHLHIANQRKDNAHKVARALVNKYGYIFVEDLNVKGMVCNQHLAKAIHDAGWGVLLGILKRGLRRLGRIA